MELSQLIYDLQTDGSFERIARDPGLQFGVSPERFVGAGILPERTIDGNVLEEEGMRYRSIIANDAARYSPVQLKEGAALFGTMTARLADSDIGKEFTAKQYDDVRKLLNRGGTMEAAARFLGWLDTEVNQALLRLNEKHRWNALEHASITRLGDNGYTETVAYPNPAGHRVTVGGSWDTQTGGVNDRDPFVDIFAVFEAARDKGVIFSRIIMSSAIQFRLLRNTKIQDRSQFGQFVPPNNQIFRAPMAVPALAALFQSQGLPAPEVFDGTYEDAAGRHRYLGEDKMVFLGQTGRTEEIQPVEGDPFYVSETLGYTAVGTAAGQDNPGRVINVIVEDRRKPPRIDVEGWQTSLPAILDGEKVFVLDTVI